MKNKAGTLSIEQMYHFRCGNCDKWWSIGDPPEQAGALKKKIWFCPWCGQKQGIEQDKNK